MPSVLFLAERLTPLRICSGLVSRFSSASSPQDQALSRWIHESDRSQLSNSQFLIERNDCTPAAPGRCAPSTTARGHARTSSRASLYGLAHFENDNGANIYISANPLRAGSRKRTKECVASVRHLYIDIDEDGDARLAALRSSDAVPCPNRDHFNIAPANTRPYGESLASISRVRNRPSS